MTRRRAVRAKATTRRSARTESASDALRPRRGSRGARLRGFFRLARPAAALRSPASPSRSPSSAAGARGLANAKSAARARLAAPSGYSRRTRDALHESWEQSWGLRSRLGSSGRLTPDRRRRDDLTRGTCAHNNPRLFKEIRCRTDQKYRSRRPCRGSLCAESPCLCIAVEFLWIAGFPLCPSRLQCARRIA